MTLGEFHICSQWTDSRDSVVKEAVRIARHIPQTNFSEAESVQIKWIDGITVPV
jgi:hypothetical protein